MSENEATEQDEPDYERAHDFFANRYVERGMLKWQGYFLSDHTSELNKQAAEKAQVLEPKPLMSQEDISKLLQRSYAEHYSISLQLFSTSSDSQLKPDTVGMVVGYIDDAVVVLDPDAQIRLENIRHAELIK